MCLQGDTVNLASRMESKGAPGRIQVCPATKAMVENMFEFENRGEIDVKGKGQINTFFLLGVKKDTTVDLPQRTEDSYSIYGSEPVPSFKSERRGSAMPSSANMQSLFALSQEHHSQGSPRTSRGGRSPRIAPQRTGNLPLVQETDEEPVLDNGSGVGTGSHPGSKADPLEIEGE